MRVEPKDLTKGVEVLRGFDATWICLFGSVLETPDDASDSIWRVKVFRPNARLLRAGGRPV